MNCNGTEHRGLKARASPWMPSCPDFLLLYFTWCTGNHVWQAMPELCGLESSRLTLQGSWNSATYIQKLVQSFKYSGELHVTLTSKVVVYWYILPMPMSQQSYVWSQHPPTQWNLRGGWWSSVGQYIEEKKPKILPVEVVVYSPSPAER